MLENKNVLKVLSLLLAIVLWAFVLGEVNPTVKKTITNIPVEFTNVEQLESIRLASLSKMTFFPIDLSEFHFKKKYTQKQSHSKVQHFSTPTYFH